MPRIRILIVDDHPVVRHGLRGMLNTVVDFDVVADASTGEEAMAEVAAWTPHVVLLDVRLGEQDGIQLARQIRTAARASRVIFLTMHDDPEYVTRAFEADAHGYLLKGSSADEIVRAIQLVAHDERVVTAELQSQLLKDYTALARDRSRDHSYLSSHELGILRGMSTGMDYKTIARTLHLSEVTVRRRVQSLYRKLDVKDRAEAVAVAIRRGFI